MHRIFVRLAALSALSPLSLGLLGCGGSHATADDTQLLAPPSAQEGLQLGVDVDAPAGTEIWKCKIMPLPFTDTTAVRAAHSINNGAVHHMDLSTITTAGVPTQPGIYDCPALYRDYPKLMDEITLYGSQAVEQKFAFPEGTAALIPPGLTVMYELHYVNATNKPQTIHSRLNVYTTPTSSVKKNVWGGAVRDLSLNIPPRATDHVEWVRCVMTKDIDLLFVAMHTHKLGTRSTISLFDGHDVTRQIYSNTDWQTAKLEDFTAAPLHVPAGEGFEFACHYRNAGTATIHWGLSADDEMCNLALGFTPGDSSIRCRFVETSDGQKIIQGSGLGE